MISRPLQCPGQNSGWSNHGWSSGVWALQLHLKPPSDLWLLAQDLWVRCYVEMLEGFLKSIMPTEEVMRAMGNSKQAFQVDSFPAMTCALSNLKVML